MVNHDREELLRCRRCSWFEKKWDAKFKRTSRTIFMKKNSLQNSSHTIHIFRYIYIIYIYGIFTCICHENQPNLGIPCMDGMAFQISPKIDEHIVDGRNPKQLPGI